MSLVEVSAKGVARPRWATRYAVFLRKVLREMDEMGWEVSFLLCSDEVIRDLNRKYRNTDCATDVLSFRQADSSDPGHAGTAGDVVISLETLRRNAARFDVGEEDELKRLGVHGLLHLAGMDHGRGERDAMLSLQDRILGKLGKERILARQSRR